MYMMIESGLLGNIQGPIIWGSRAIQGDWVISVYLRVLSGQSVFVFFLIVAHEGFTIGEKAEYYFFFYRIK